MSLDIEARLRDANPLPRDGQLEQLHGQDLAHRLRSDIRAKREGRMTDTTDRRQPETEQEQRTSDRVVADRTGRGRWVRPGLATVATAALIAIAVASAVLLTRGDQDVAGAPTDPVEVAEAFVNAYGSFDADLAASYLSDGVLVQNDLEGLRLDLAFWEATGYLQLVDTCEPAGAETVAGGVLIRCTYDYHALRSGEIGLGPYGGSWFDLTIRDGEIVDWDGTFEFMTNGFSAEMWEPFAIWVAANHADDVPIMYLDGGRQSLEARTEESIPLWEQYTMEYVAIVNQGS